MAVAPAALSDWYQSQINTGVANNGILTTGGIAPNPTGAKPDLNSSTPITTASQPSTYKGLSTASTQLTEPTKWNVTPLACSLTLDLTMPQVEVSVSPFFR